MAERSPLLEPLPRLASDYVAAFNLACVCRYRDGNIGVARNVHGAVEAWWCEAAAAGKLLRRVRQNSALGPEIPRLARELGVVVSAHAVVVERATAAVRCIDAALAGMQASGGLAFFNSEYRRRRLEATRRGERFMSYGQARARLRKALARVAAGRVPRSLVAEVFDAP